ncbi:MAG: hypothetical protein AABX51_04895 [Nanoarchaeota archaeon]
MANKYPLVFDEVMIKQLQKAAKNIQIKTILTKMLNKLEQLGPDSGKLLDSKLFIYEVKIKRPPVRLYFKHNIQTDEIYVFEYEMKTSEDNQQRSINRLRRKP